MHRTCVHAGIESLNVRAQNRYEAIAELVFQPELPVLRRVSASLSNGQVKGAQPETIKHMLH